ncbi:hypothetical protein ACH5RR_025650 [Cinchona calisaya]|uniref:Protein FAR1-RELATED SEQUENCE n=1 Tax=Cinchona calisaya TaxID=153742 RepID=A0ABD2Z1C9_9GENT
MGNKSPKTFMTDQAQAIINAVEVVFPDCRHRLYLWHISQNAPSYLPKFKTAGFQDLFYHCLSSCETEFEFEATWSRMIREYNLEGHCWLERLYGLRHKWCTALNNDAFSAGFRSTSRSEGTNNVLKEIGHVRTSLTIFVLEFERKMREWRQSEADADFMCKQGRKSIQVKESTLLQQAARHYTHKLYKMFEQEFMGILAASFVLKSSSSVMHEFEVSTRSIGQQRESIVRLNFEKMEVNCTCKKFESMGLLCTHALGAYRFVNMGKIPDMYLLSRWGQEAKKRVTDIDQENFFQMTATGSQALFTNTDMRYAYDMITRRQWHEGARILLWKSLEDTNSKLDDL